MSHSIEAAIISRVRGISCSRKPVGVEARLYHDLNIAGDDAGELLEAIARDYGVNFDGFDFEKYFPNESEAIFYRWGSFFGIWKNRFRPFKFGHLVAIATLGKWFDPDR